MAARWRVKIMAIGKTGRMAAALLLMALATACAPAEGEKAAAQAERLKVIVEFGVPEPPGGLSLTQGDAVNAVRKVADAILARLEAPVRESAKLFEHLPLIALEVDAAAVMQLLSMPEVVSVQPDHPVTIIDQPGGVKTYGAPSSQAPK